MTPERWQRASAAFDAALQAEPGLRAALLRARLGDDVELLSMVLAMLEQDAVEEQAPTPPLATLPELAPHDEWADGHLVGNYRIRRKLGQGGMGEVYLGERCDGLHHQVAIKRLRGGIFHPDLKRRFLQERQILARLQHPLIARFLDAGADAEGRPYAVMEFVDGTAITEHAVQRQLGLEARLELFLQVAQALSYAHRQLVVHRDIKASNVLVDREGRPRLLDFGIAKVLGDIEGGSASETAFELRAFSLEHAAPEQLRGEPCGVSCDVYAMGVLLYELLCGCTPLVTRGLAYGEAERLILETVPRAPSARAAEGHATAVPARVLRGDLDNIVMHALKKAPGERYGSIEELADDLRRFLRSEPISLRVDHRWYRLGRLLRRQWLPLGLGAACILTLAGGALAFHAQWRVAEQQRDQAQAALGLLKDSFRAANPLELQGAEITARQILDASRTVLDARMAAAPLELADLAMSLAEVELAIGRPREAQAMVQRAWEGLGQRGRRSELLHLLRARTALAVGEPEVAASMLAWAEEEQFSASFEWRLLRGRWLTHQDRYDEAIDVLEGLADDRVATLGAQDLEARRLLAQAYRLQARYADALALLDRSLLRLRRERGDGHPEVLLTRLLRLDPLRRSGARQEALDEALSLIAEIDGVFGPGSTMYAAALSTLGSALNETGETEGAAVVFADALQAWRRAAGENHPNTLRVGFNLAQLQASLGRPNEAEKLYRESLGRGEHSLGGDRHTVLFWRLVLAEFLAGQQRHDEALEVYAQAGDALLRLRREWMLQRYHDGLQRSLEASSCVHAPRAIASATCSQAKDALQSFAAAQTELANSAEPLSHHGNTP